MTEAASTLGLAEERAAARERARQRQVIERRRIYARDVLAGRWNAGEAEIRELLTERYPQLRGSGNAEEFEIVVAATLQVQKEERPRVDPSQVRTRAPQPEVLKPPRRRTKIPAPAAPEPEGEKPMEASVKENHVAAPRAVADLKLLALDARKQINQVVTSELKANPAAEPTVIRQAVSDAVGVELTDAQLDYQISRARLTIRSGKTQKKGPERKKASNPDATGADIPQGMESPVEATSPDLTVSAQVEEIRSLRATYEDADFIRLEEEGELWLVRASIPFDKLADAAHVLGMIGVAVAAVKK